MHSFLSNALVRKKHYLGTLRYLLDELPYLQQWSGQFWHQRLAARINSSINFIYLNNLLAWIWPKHRKINGQLNNKLRQFLHIQYQRGINCYVDQYYKTYFVLPNWWNCELPMAIFDFPPPPPYWLLWVHHGPSPQPNSTQDSNIRSFEHRYLKVQQCLET